MDHTKRSFVASDSVSCAEEGMEGELDVHAGAAFAASVASCVASPSPAARGERSRGEEECDNSDEADDRWSCRGCSAAVVP